MKQFLLTLLFAATLLTTVAAQPLPQTAPELVGMSSERLANADHVILKAIENKEIPGAVLAVVHQNKLAYLKAFGNKQTYPGAVPMDVNTVFDMASVSKSMSTAISAVILIERGQLRLQDKVKDYIPGFQGWKDENGKETDIRLADIMTHTSGLPPYANVDSLRAKYGAPNPDGLIDYIAHCRRDFAPTKGFQYSCLNYITLQRVIETVSGQSLRDFAKQNIFDVLDMVHTDYKPTGETLARTAPTEKQADGTVLRGVVHDPLAQVMNGGVSGNAGVFSDARDIALLSAALLNGGAYNGKRILSPAGVKMMRSVPRNVVDYGRTPGWDVHSPYASNNGDLFGANTYGHTGYTGTSVIIDPDTRTAVILLTNRVHPDDAGSVVRLRSLVANAVAAAIDCPPKRVYYQHYYNMVARYDSLKNDINRRSVVMLGDSMTENGDWDALLGKRNIINRGINGDELYGIYDRLEQILPGTPRKIFIMAGINDVSHDESTDTIVARTRMIIDRIQRESPKTLIYIQSLLPIDESQGRYKRLTGKSAQIVEINKRLETMCREREIPFINMYHYFVEPDTNVLAPTLTNDGLHLTPEGYQVWARVLKPYI